MGFHFREVASIVLGFCQKHTRYVVEMLCRCTVSKTQALFILFLPVTTTQYARRITSNKAAM
ncbi:hypothetical protein ROD_30241 [Citrobacter rodentium ICC168]|uniref:Uncharacterized protein n=1 Tax=Citrobacter rodentium (strain ICC168) TaxID=637910 RepID=D2TKI3_CITRI|nr:hypothetical protein ROD_30241 [Citrobacter rodentium ICC168]